MGNNADVPAAHEAAALPIPGEQAARDGWAMRSELLDRVGHRVAAEEKEGAGGRWLEFTPRPGWEFTNTIVAVEVKDLKVVNNRTLTGSMTFVEPAAHNPSTRVGISDMVELLTRTFVRASDPPI